MQKPDLHEADQFVGHPTHKAQRVRATYLGMYKLVLEIRDRFLEAVLTCDPSSDRSVSADVLKGCLYCDWSD